MAIYVLMNFIQLWMYLINNKKVCGKGKFGERISGKNAVQVYNLLYL